MNPIIQHLSLMRRQCGRRVLTAQCISNDQRICRCRRLHGRVCGLSCRLPRFKNRVFHVSERCVQLFHPLFHTQYALFQLSECGRITIRPVQRADRPRKLKTDDVGTPFHLSAGSADLHRNTAALRHPAALEFHRQHAVLLCEIYIVFPYAEFHSENPSGIILIQLNTDALRLILPQISQSALFRGRSKHKMSVFGFQFHDDSSCYAAVPELFRLLSRVQHNQRLSSERSFSAVETKLLF